MGKVRRWLAAGVALAALGTGSAVAWSVMAADSDRPDPGPSLKTLNADDAAPASAGLSRRIRRELAEQVRFVGVPWASTTKPRLVIGAQRFPTSVEVVDPRTGERTSLPPLWKGHSVSVLPARLTRRAVWVSWVHHVNGVQRPAVMRYVLATGEHRLFLAPSAPHHPRANFTSALEYGDDHRFYFRTSRPGHDGPDKFTQLWSFALDAPKGVRSEGEAQQWAVAGSVLASLDYGDGKPVTVRVRDLTTGGDRTRTLPACDDPYLEASSAFVVVACGVESVLLVLDRTGTPLVRMAIPDGVNAAGSGPPSLHVGERWLSVGRLAYRPATGQLLRLREPTRP